MNLSKKDPCPHCGRYENRPITVDAVIIKNDKILLIKRGSDPQKGKWAIPGGYVGFDETVEEATKREVKEETALETTSLKFIRFSSDPKRHPKQAVNFVFLVEVSGEVNASDDASETKWFEIAEIPKDLAFDHNFNIEQALKKVYP